MTSAATRRPIRRGAATGWGWPAILLAVGLLLPHSAWAEAPSADRMCQVIRFLYVNLPEPDCDGRGHHLNAFETENDVLVPSLNAGGSRDSFYTGGFRFQKLFLDAPLYTDTFGRHQNIGLIVGLQVYTAQNIRDVEPKPGDHPYAGYLYAGTEFEFASTHGKPDNACWGAVCLGSDLFFHFDWQLGTLGPNSLAGAFQNFIHDQISVASPTPQGWKSQVPNEVTLQSTFELLIPYTSLLIYGGGDARKFDVMVPLFRIRQGAVYQTFESEIVARWSPAGRLAPVMTSTDTTLSADKVEDGWWSWSSLMVFFKGTNIMAYHNATIQGGKGGCATCTETIRRQVFDVEGGFRLRLWSIHVEFSAVQRSAEIAGKNAVDAPSHSFGRLAFIYND